MVLLLLLVVLHDRLLLELTNMTGHSFEVLLEFSDLRVRLEQILRIEVTIGAHLLIQIELQLELSLRFEVLLLQLGDQVILKLDLLEARIVSGISCRSLLSVYLFVLLQLDVLLTQLLHANGIRLLLELDLGELLLIHLYLVFCLALGLFLSHKITIQELTFVDLRIDFLLLIFDETLLFLLHLYLLLVLHVNLFSLKAEIVLPDSSLVRSPLNRIFLLCEAPELLLSCVKIRLLRCQVGSMLCVLRHESRVIFFSLGQDLTGLTEFIFFSAHFGLGIIKCLFSLLSLVLRIFLLLLVRSLRLFKF